MIVSFGMADSPKRPLSPAKWEALRKAKAAQAGKEVRGEQNGNAKLTEAQVRKIRALRAAGERPSILALRYNVDRTLIWHIVKRKVWAHI